MEALGILLILGLGGLIAGLTDRKSESKPEPKKRSVARSYVVKEFERIETDRGQRFVIRKTPTVSDIPVGWLIPENENFNGADNRYDD